jgi:ABC-type uncharacterized transport system ATPase subunit
LYKGARLIVLDEPTAVLTPQETQSLFSIMRDLKQNGCTIIFISHKLKEVLEIADAVTVIRDGRTVNTWPIDEVNENILASCMVGRDVLLEVYKELFKATQVQVMKVENLSVKAKHMEQGIEAISLELNEGEIFGIIGIAGNGQEALIEGILGIQKAVSGSVTLNGVEVTNRIPMDFRQLSIGCIASDRLKEGLIKEFNVAENALLGYQRNRSLRKGIFLSWNKINSWTDAIVRKYRVKTDSNGAAITSLSGGNQQKLIIGRELSNMPKLILAIQPTRGVDIGSIEFIYENLLEHRRNKAAILLVSQELEEVLSLSDRIGVLFRGKLMGVGKPSEFSKEQIGLMMAGIVNMEAVVHE